MHNDDQKNIVGNNQNNKQDDNMDINSIDRKLEQLRSTNDDYVVYKCTEFIQALSKQIRSADTPSTIACCDKILQKSLSSRGNTFQIISADLFDAPNLIAFLDVLLQKDMPLAVYNILLYQGSDNEAKPAGYELAHGEYRSRFFEKIINKLPEDMAKNLQEAAFVIYLDEERTEAVEYDLLGDGVRYLL